MKKSIFTLSLLLSTLAMDAQVYVNGGLGAGISYVKTKNINSRFLPIFSPNISVVTAIPIKGKFAMQLGAGYSLKGYNTRQVEDYGDDKNVFTTKTRLHYLSLPLLLSYRAYQRNDRQIWIDGGMNYDLFLRGKTSYNYTTYTGDEVKTSSGYAQRVKGVFSPSKYGPAENSYDMNGLDVAVRVQMRYQWAERYAVSIYYQGSLYDQRATTGEDATSSVKARYAGVSFGYTLF